MDQNNNKYNLNFFGNVNVHIFLIKQKSKNLHLLSESKHRSNFMQSSDVS